MRASGRCERMVMWCTVLHHLPVATALAAQLCLCAILAAALPTSSAHLSMLTDKLRWFRSRDSLEADALAGTCLLWPTLLQKQLQRAEVLYGVGSAWSQQEFRMSPDLSHQHVPHSSLNASVILECCQHAFQPKETEKWNNRDLTFNVSTKAERNFQVKDTFLPQGHSLCRVWICASKKWRSDPFTENDHESPLQKQRLSNPNVG